MSLIVRLYHKVMHFIFVQLFISLIALPLVLYRGLPISYMTIVGNFLFTPFLSLFLLLSTLMFLTELCNIPNAIIVLALDYISSFWLWFMQHGSSSWLLYFVQPPFILALFIPLLTLSVLHLRIHSYVYMNVVLVIYAMILMFYLSYVLPPHSSILSIPCNKDAVTLIFHHKQTVLIDPGVIARNANPSSWIEYTLLPTMAQKIGSCSIDHLIILQPSPRIFKAIESLCLLTHVRTLYMPFWKGTLKKHQWRQFFSMKHILHQHATQFLRITTSYTLHLDQDASLTISPHAGVKSGVLRYTPLNVQGHIENNPILVRPYKRFTKQT